MSIRTERVASLLQRDIASILTTEFGEQLKPMVTVTGVRVTPDLSIAYIYVSVLAESESQRHASLRHLKELKSRIRSSLAKSIRHQLKSVPELRFFLDETQEQARRLDDLFGRIREERERRGIQESDSQPEQS